MSKSQAAPEVLRSITASLVATLALSTSGCLSPNGGEMTTNVNLSSETGGPDSTSGSEAEGSTRGDIMTTTEDPDTSEPMHESTDASAAETSTGSETTTPVIGCGDGLVQEDEECDLGPQNADDGMCSTECKLAKCGDGKVQKGELCDDGLNDGAYGGCAVDCSARAPYCGDGQLQGDYEACDENDPHSGCSPVSCEYATSCKQIREESPDNPEVVDGVYWIKPGDKDKVKVLCDMDADGGGYTFLKVSLPDPGAKKNAYEAESYCKLYGMQLLVPRSPAHAMAAVVMAKSTDLVPVGEGVKKSGLDYLSLLGIYPVTENKSCVGKKFNNVDCPEWKAVGKTFWVTDSVDPSLPGTKNCAKCSNLYTWKDDGTLDYYETPYFNGVGPDTYRFICDIGDKLPPPG